MSDVLQNKKILSWKYITKFYPEYRSKSAYFQQLLNQYLSSETVLLDLGCGRGLESMRDYTAVCRHSYGVDPTDAVFENKTIHEPLKGSAYEIPIGDEVLDVVVSQQVLEHIEFPERMFKEVARVLKPGGLFAAMTPNLWYPTTVVSAVTPYSFHRWVNSALLSVDEDDTFPTFYRANRLSTLQKLGREAGLSPKFHQYFMSNPGQFEFSPILTRAEVLFIRILDAWSALAKLKDTIIIFYEKSD